MTSYPSALAYIDQFLNTEKSPNFSQHARYYNLSRVTALFDQLDNPQKNQRFIHVGGSKGKGSTATFIAGILTKSGYKTGLFTSPHFVSPRERCRINGIPISQNDFTRCLSEIQPAIASVLEKEDEWGRLSFFELYTALSIYCFAQQRTDWAVIEVGLGGRLDATNVIQPELSVITPISLEHQYILGDTIAEIASQKAGIIKPKIPLVLGPQTKSAKDVFEKSAKQNCAPIFHVPHDLTVKKHDVNGQLFDFGNYSNVSISVAGPYQPINSATAITAVQHLNLNPKLSPLAIEQGVAETELIGRFQVISLANRPQNVANQAVLDGAHTPDSIEALLRTIGQIFDTPKLIVVVSLMKDKQITAIGQNICRFADQVITTQSFHNTRVAKAQTLAEDWKMFQADIVSVPNVIDAFQMSMVIEADLICVTGSIYLVGEILKQLNIANIDMKSKPKNFEKQYQI